MLVNTQTDRRTVTRPKGLSSRAIGVTFLRNVNSGLSASRRIKMKCRECEGVQTKERHLYCEVQVEMSGGPV